MQTRRTAIAAAALLFAATAALAGSYATVTTQDGTGTHTTRVYDVSGTGVGPFVPVADGVVQGAAVYQGGTITAGGTAQSFLAANPTRRGFTIQNQSTGDLYIRIGGSPATLDRLSLKIAPGYLYETPSHHVSAGAVSIIGATTGQAFYATEF